MNSLKINCLYSIMEFCDIQTLFNMKFINRRNLKFSILKSKLLGLIKNMWNNYEIIDFHLDNKNLLKFFKKNKIEESKEMKIILSYLIFRKISKQKYNRKKKEANKFLISNRWHIENEKLMIILYESICLIDKNFLFKSDNFLIKYVYDFEKEITKEDKIIISLINRIGKIEKIQFIQTNSHLKSKVEIRNGLNYSNLFNGVSVIKSIDLSEKEEENKIESILEFIYQNLNLKRLNIYSIKINGFPYSDKNMKYAKNLHFFIETNKEIFHLKKISFSCYFSYDNFFTNFKTEENFKFFTNFYENLFSAFESCENFNLVTFKFPKIESYNTINEIYFYLYCLSNVEGIINTIKNIKIKYIYSKSILFKIFDVEFYKKFIQEILAFKNFSVFKYLNEDHFNKFYSQAHLDVIKLKEKNLKNHFTKKEEILNSIKSDEKNIKESEFELYSDNSDDYSNYCMKNNHTDTNGELIDEIINDEYADFKIMNDSSKEDKEIISFNRFDEDLLFRDSFKNREFQEYNDSNRNKLGIIEDISLNSNNVDQDISYFEIKKCLNKFSNVKFKIKNWRKREKFILDLKRFNNNFEFENLINLDLKIDCFSENTCKIKKIFKKFPKSLRKISFDFNFFNKILINEILINIINSDLKKLEKFKFTFEYISLINLSIFKDGIEYFTSIHDTTDILNFDILNDNLKRIILMNQIIEFEFCCKFLNMNSHYDFINEENHFELSYVELGFYKFDLLFLNKDLLNYILNKINGSEDYISLTLNFSDFPQNNEKSGNYNLGLEYHENIGKKIILKNDIIYILKNISFLNYFDSYCISDSSRILMNKLTKLTLINFNNDSSQNLSNYQITIFKNLINLKKLKILIKFSNENILNKFPKIKLNEYYCDISKNILNLFLKEEDNKNPILSYNQNNPNLIKLNKFHLIVKNESENDFVLFLLQNLMDSNYLDSLENLKIVYNLQIDQCLIFFNFLIENKNRLINLKNLEVKLSNMIDFDNDSYGFSQDLYYELINLVKLEIINHLVSF